jgi:hypothetical protein
MPKYRSVALSVMSQWEMKQFPEFPHPDSVHYTYHGPGLGTDGSTRRRYTEPTVTAEPTCKVERAPSKVPLVSCYIPSVQGTYRTLLFPDILTLISICRCAILLQVRY